MSVLPEKFIARLERIIPSTIFNSVLETFGMEKDIALRINTIKQKDSASFLQKLKDNHLEYSQVPWFTNGYRIHCTDKSKITGWSDFEEGYAYIQNLSSMFVPIVLNPKEGERILDLCAAPGSKTTQIADMINQQGSITAVEHIKQRFYKLKNVMALLGVENVDAKLVDGRRYRSDGMLFDKVLVDAPCSSEGRFSLTNKKTFRYWHLHKIKEMAHKQKGLLLNASRCLKNNGSIVYSTCTFAPEENEGVVDWFLKKTQGAFKLEAIDAHDLPVYPAILDWGNKKSYHPDIKQCLRICPTEIMDGFFIAKFRKVKEVLS